MLHTESSPLRGRNIKIKFTGEGHPQLPDSKDKIFDAWVEDWWDKLTGGSWMFADGNPACLFYAMRIGFARDIPLDDDVLYVKIGSMGHLVHMNEIVTSQEETDGTPTIISAQA